MGDGSLSQEEIDALLMGANDGADLGGGDFAAAAPADTGISPSERELLADAFNEAMTNASSSAGSLVNKTVSITNAVVEEIPTGSAATETAADSVAVQINMGGAQTVMVFAGESAKLISSGMMGMGEAPAEMDDAHLNTLGELANTMLGSISNSLGGKFKEDLMPSQPTVKLINSPADFPAISGDKVAKITYNLSIDGANNAKFMHYISAANAGTWARNSGGGAAAMGGGMAGIGGDDLDGLAGLAGDMGGAPPAVSQVPVNPVNYPSLQTSSMPARTPPNLQLLLDVQMVLTVELGRTKKYVKDILSLGEGSIIELDKLAGEPVDLLINGKLIAKGEVVVIDENFGVRVTDIVGPEDRLSAMQSG